MQKLYCCKKSILPHHLPDPLLQFLNSPFSYRTDEDGIQFCEFKIFLIFHPSVYNSRVFTNKSYYAIYNNLHTGAGVRVYGGSSGITRMCFIWRKYGRSKRDGTRRHKGVYIFSEETRGICSDGSKNPIYLLSFCL